MEFYVWNYNGTENHDSLGIKITYSIISESRHLTYELFFLIPHEYKSVKWLVGLEMFISLYILPIILLGALSSLI